MSEGRVFVAYPDHEMGLDEKDFFGTFVNDLRATGYLVNVRPNVHNHSGAQINEAVENALGRSECLIAFIDRHSISVGVYLAFALWRQLPVLCLHSPDVAPTRTASGLSERSFAGWAKPTLKPYHDEREAFNLAVEFIKYGPTAG